MKSAIIIRLPITQPFPREMNGVFIFKHIVKEKIFSVSMLLQVEGCYMMNSDDIYFTRKTKTNERIKGRNNMHFKRR